MITSKALILLLVGAGSVQVAAAFTRDHKTCSELADIGANAWQTKQDGHTLGEVMATVKKVLPTDPMKRQAVEGTIIAVYGDNSLKSAAQARRAIYDGCKP